MFLSRLNPVSVFHWLKSLNGLVLLLFLSRLNPVSVFHRLQTGIGLTRWSVLFLSRLNPVSVFHPTPYRGRNPGKSVSIPPKSGLSFSQYEELCKKLFD